MAVTPSSASTCMIMRAPLMLWPASGVPSGRGWITVSLMDALFGTRAAEELGGNKSAQQLASVVQTRADPLFWRMRHIIAILLQNEAGALTRVAGLFSTRGYNIESLSVAPTDDPTVSRLTLVTTGSDQVIQQIASQLNKLVDVVNVLDMTRGEHLERELVLLKLRLEPAHTHPAPGQLVRSGGRVLDPAADGFVVELTASEAQDNIFVAQLGLATVLLKAVRRRALCLSRTVRAQRT